MQGYRWRQYGSPPRNDCAPSGFSRHLGTPLCLACPQASYGRQAGWDAISGASAPLGSAFSCGHRLTRPTNLCAGEFKAPVAAWSGACSARRSPGHASNADRAEPFALGLGEQAPGILRQNKTRPHSARLADGGAVAVSVWVTLLQRTGAGRLARELLLAARKSKRSSPCDAQAMRRDQPSPTSVEGGAPVSTRAYKEKPRR